MKFSNILIILAIAATYVACAHKQSESKDDVGFIDPDQRALPKDGSIAISHGAVTDTTLDGKGEVIAAASDSVSPQNTEKSSAINDEPTLEPTSKTVEAPRETSTLSELDNSRDSASSSANQKIGTGRLIRYIKAKDLNIRSQPNRYSKIIGMLNGGDKVHVTIIGGWAKLDEGKWIRTRWLSRNPPKVIVGGESHDHESEDESESRAEPRTKKSLKNHKKSKRK